MPPTPDDEGLRFLERVIEYAETVIFPGGTCRCGSALDFSIQAKHAPVATAVGGGAIIGYTLTCMGCNAAFEVSAASLLSYIADPPVEAECPICHRMLQLVMHPGAPAAVCGQCGEVEQQLGHIVEIQENVPTL